MPVKDLTERCVHMKRGRNQPIACKLCKILITSQINETQEIRRKLTTKKGKSCADMKLADSLHFK